jgi:hypothetical protein
MRGVFGYAGYPRASNGVTAARDKILLFARVQWTEIAFLRFAFACRTLLG